MQHPERVRSEVARILAHIQKEYESGVLGLSGLASGTAKHEFITARMERMGELQNELCQLVGADQAIELFAHALEDGSEMPDCSGQV